MKPGPDPPDAGRGGLELLLLRRGRDRQFRPGERADGARSHPGLAQPEPGLALQGRRGRGPDPVACQPRADAPAPGESHPEGRAALSGRRLVLGRRQRGDRSEPAGRSPALRLVQPRGADRLHRPGLPGRVRGGPGREALHQRLHDDRPGKTPGTPQGRAGDAVPGGSGQLRRPPDARERGRPTPDRHRPDDPAIRRPRPGQPDHRDGRQRLHRQHVAVRGRPAGAPVPAGVPVPGSLPSNTGF